MLSARIRRVLCRLGLHAPNRSRPLECIEMPVTLHRLDGTLEQTTRFYAEVECIDCLQVLPPVLLGGRCGVCGATPIQPCDAGLHG